MTISKKCKPTIRSVVFVFMGLTLVVVCELVDGDKGVIIGFKEQANHFENGFSFVVGCAATYGI